MREAEEDDDVVKIEFGVNDDFTEWSIYVFCEIPLHTKEFCKALRKFADAYERGEIVAPPYSGAEDGACIQ